MECSRKQHSRQRRYRHRSRRRSGGWSGSAGDSTCRSGFARRNRPPAARSGGSRPQRQVAPRRFDRRHLHHQQSRNVRRRFLHGDHYSSAGRNPRSRSHRGSRACDRRSASGSRHDDLNVIERSPRDRWRARRRFSARPDRGNRRSAEMPQRNSEAGK